MPRPRLARAAALGIALAAVASPVAAQQSSDDVFRAYLATPVAASALTLVPVEQASAAQGEDEAASTTTTATAGWFGGDRLYVLGGAAAIGAGVMLSRSTGGSASLAAPPANDPALLPSLPTPALSSPAVGAPVVSPQVIVNPEPGTVLLLGSGLAGLALFARRRQRAVAAGRA